MKRILWLLLLTALIGYGCMREKRSELSAPPPSNAYLGSGAVVPTAGAGPPIVEPEHSWFGRLCGWFKAHDAGAANRPASSDGGDDQPHAVYAD